MNVPLNVKCNIQCCAGYIELGQVDRLYPGFVCLGFKPTEANAQRALFAVALAKAESEQALASLAVATPCEARGTKADC